MMKKMYESCKAFVEAYEAKNKDLLEKEEFMFIVFYKIKNMKYRQDVTLIFNKKDNAIFRHKSIINKILEQHNYFFKTTFMANDLKLNTIVRIN